MKGLIKKNIAILLDGPINSDGRVIKIIKSLSKYHKVYVISSKTRVENNINFNSNVISDTYELKNNWLYRNFLFHKKFGNIYNIILKYNIDFDVIYCNDYPTLKIGVSLKNKLIKPKLIYDSHEIYIETINQFFPSHGFKKIYGYFLTKINKLLLP